jgi:hypothetical protein
MSPISVTKLSMYEQIGYIMTGTLAVLLALLDYQLATHANSLPQISISEALILVVLAYWAGHIAQVLANLLVPYPKREFTPQDKRILKRIRSHIDLDCTDEETMGYAMMFGYQNDVTGQIASFNANYGVYRGAAIIFVIEAVALAATGFTSGPQWLAWGAVGSATASWLFLRRSKRFYKYIGNKTLQVAAIKLRASTDNAKLT